jgi:hypothetical protein
VNPSPGRCQHLEALHGFAVKQHPAGAEVLLEAVEGDRGGQHAGADGRLGGGLIAHASGNAGDRSTISASRFPRGRPIRITQRGTSCPTTATPDDRDARLAELHRLRLGDILYPGNSGCAGARGSGGGAPSPCQGEMTAAAMKHYHGPKPQRARIFLCDLHARLEADRAELVSRDEALAAARADHAEALEQAAPRGCGGRRPGPHPAHRRAGAATHRAHRRHPVTDRRARPPARRATPSARRRPRDPRPPSTANRCRPRCLRRTLSAEDRVQDRRAGMSGHLLGGGVGHTS